MTGEIDISAADANQAYGALAEGLHIASYSLERAFCVHLEPLIGGNAWRKCGAVLDDINVFMDSLRLDKFRMIAEQRKHIVQRIKELQPDVSNRPIARTLGVHHDTVNRDVGGNPPGPENNDSDINGLKDGSGGNPPEAAPYRTLGTGDNEWWTPVEHIACMRVDGEICPLCQNALDQPPICSPTICPILAPSIEPIAPPTIPPIGTQACRMQQVCDGFGSCEWKQLCY